MALVVAPFSAAYLGGYLFVTGPSPGRAAQRAWGDRGLYWASQALTRGSYSTHSGRKLELWGSPRGGSRLQNPAVQVAAGMGQFS